MRGGITSDAFLSPTEVVTPSRAASSTRAPLSVVDGRLWQVMLTSRWTATSSLTAAERAKGVYSSLTLAAFSRYTYSR